MSYDPERREFLLGVARWLLAGGGTATVVALNAKPGEACTHMGVCDGCGRVSDCGLPQALSYRDHRAMVHTHPAEEGDA